MTKNVFLVSLGCPKNLVDSEVMLAELTSAGYQVCESAEEADLLLINTCGFIQPAVEEAIDHILMLSAVKEASPGMQLVVTGCMVQRYGKQLQQELPEVDLFVGVDDFPHIIELIKQVSDEPGKLVVRSSHFIMNAETPRQISTPLHRAYLKISEGCSNRCSYCLIPSIRGPLRSRSITDLSREALQLAQAGVQELTFVGQDVTAYGLDLGRQNANLCALLRHILEKTDIAWLRLLYLYPNRISNELLTMMAEEQRLLPYLDIPLQHISSTVLKRMNRPFNTGQVRKLIERIRTVLPQAAIRTTFIVGFPGETEKDVEEIAHFLKTYRLNNVGIFTYSNEEGCAAEHFDGQLSEEIKQQRRDYLMDIQSHISLAKNQEYVGKTLPVLIEGISRESELLLEGRTTFQAPEIDGCVYITDGQCQAGKISLVTINEAHTYDLVGEVIEN